MLDSDKTVPHQAAIERIVNDIVGGGGGGGSAGAAIIRKFPFTFDTPGLLTGHAVYTPTIGDILLDAWIEIDTAWNGVTPKADIGNFNSVQWGWFVNTGPIDMTLHDDVLRADDGYIAGASSSNVTLATNNSGTRLAPGKFTTTDPVKVVVSQDGTITGADPGSTQGAATLYLVTCTPV